VILVKELLSKPSFSPPGTGPARPPPAGLSTPLPYCVKIRITLAPFSSFFFTDTGPDNLSAILSHQSVYDEGQPLREPLLSRRGKAFLEPPDAEVSHGNLDSRSATPLAIPSPIYPFLPFLCRRRMEITVLWAIELLPLRASCTQYDKLPLPLTSPRDDPRPVAHQRLARPSVAGIAATHPPTNPVPWDIILNLEPGSLGHWPNPPFPPVSAHSPFTPHMTRIASLANPRFVPLWYEATHATSPCAYSPRAKPPLGSLFVLGSGWPPIRLSEIPAYPSSMHLLVSGATHVPNSVLLFTLDRQTPRDGDTLPPP